MDKTLAFIITKDKHINYIVGLVSAAAKKNYDIKIFIMDRGVFLTENDKFISIIKKNNIGNVSVCEYSCNVNGVSSRTKEFNYASQFENAKMINKLKKHDRIVLF
ncbi:MAG TPA: hypothetical protein ENI54_00355 [bacterium]|nr:hypothetical protein [bacterium]